MISGVLLAALLTACGSGSTQDASAGKSTVTSKPVGAKENATAVRTCIPNVLGSVPTTDCAVDMVGPGGGLIFFAKDGQFYEVAPSNWNPDFGGSGGVACAQGGCPVGNNYSRLPRVSDQTQDVPAAQYGYGFCADSGVAKYWIDSATGGFKPPLGTAIGAGRANTQALLADPGCSGGLARLVARYTGGGKNDWFVPSKDELAELFKFGDLGAVAGFKNDWPYASSSVVPIVSSNGGSGIDVWTQKVGRDAQLFDTTDGVSHFAVRPIRQFS